MSQTRMDRSSELEMMSSYLGWKITHDTLLVCPRRVSTSHAFVSGKIKTTCLSLNSETTIYVSSWNAPFILQSLTCRSSAPEMTRGSVGWKLAQLTPRSWPSSTYFTTASAAPKRSAFTLDTTVSEDESKLGAPRTFFFRRSVHGHTPDGSVRACGFTKVRGTYSQCPKRALFGRAMQRR